LIHSAWENFMHCLSSDTPPSLSDRDVLVREDHEWKSAATKYVGIKKQLDVLATDLESAKTDLVALARHTSESGSGVTVTRFSKIGAVDYKKIPALKGVDLDLYRGTTREEIRVTVAK
ncbi:MAG: hypothetical protein NT123_21535, partial [Proteobacteria bacterium]|nr:hypothetical protein [Pseudomonadota bacterium]